MKKYRYAIYDGRGRELAAGTRRWKIFNYFLTLSEQQYVILTRASLSDSVVLATS